VPFITGELELQELEFARWMRSTGLTRNRAAIRLGILNGTYPLNLTYRLAMAALSEEVEPWPADPEKLATRS
jgi:hypothetical protein